MSKPLYKAVIKKTGKEIEVYKLNDGGYCDFSNCSDKYDKEEIEIKKEIK